MARWSVRRIAAFESDLKSLRKAHYGKNPRDFAEFVGIVDLLCEALAELPFAAEYSDPPVRVFPRPYPKGYALDGCLLAYAKFKMPGLAGSARHGRIAFEVCEPRRVVSMLAAYTHSTTGHRVDWPDASAVSRLKQGRIAFPEDERA